MSTVTFDIPEEALVTLKLDPAAAALEVRLAAGVKLYELGRLSSGSAAQLAGVPRVVFSRSSASLARLCSVKEKQRSPGISGVRESSRTRRRCFTCTSCV